MKKTFVLMTIVLAILAAPVFAEVSISGDIDFGFSSDFANPEDAADATENKEGFVYDVDDLDLDIVASVDEFTTVEFSINWDQAIIDGTDNGVIPGAFTAKTDVTGAFGIDGPAAVTLITGYNDYFETMDYATVSRIEVENIADHAIAKTIVIGADVTVNDMFTISAGLCPAMQGSDGLTLTLTDAAGNESDVTFADVSTNALGMAATPMFFQVYTTMDAMSAEFYYNANATADVVGTAGTLADVPVSRLGATANYAMPVSDIDLTFGAGFDITMVNDDVVDMDNITVVAFAANAAMGPFDASIGTAITLEYEDVDTMMALGIDAGYAVNETVTVYGGVTIDDLMGDDIWLSNSAADDGASATGGMEFGAKIMAGACQYYVGYQTGTGDIYNRTDKEGMFFRLQADY